MGGRYTRDDRNARRGEHSMARRSRTAFRNNQDFKTFQPGFHRVFREDDDINVYAKVATGYRAGGSAKAAPISPRPTAEKIVSYEGVKSTG